MRGGKRSTSFKPGQSGNPNGRPKILADVREAARQYTPEALETLAKIMRDDGSPPAARVSASNSLIERGWGKPEATASVTINKNVRDLSTVEILAALAATGVIGEEDGSDKPNSVH